MCRFFGFRGLKFMSLFMDLGFLEFVEGCRV